MMLALFLAVSFLSCEKERSTQLDQEAVKMTIGTKVSLSSTTPTGTPSTLYLIIAPNSSIELVKNGDVFNSVSYIPLQENVAYYFNTKSDGSGISYFVDEELSAYSYADDDKVSWDNSLLEVTSGQGSFKVARSQAYKLSIDFTKAELNWQYHNIKLFCYTDWAQRSEFLLAYKHPLTFERVLQLPANHNLKFYSVNPDWLEWGSNNTNSLTGALTQGSGTDITAVTEAASYTVKVTLDNTLQAGNYSFVREAALPIKLASFTGKAINKVVYLNWITSSEINVKGFEMERTEDGKTSTILPVLGKPGAFSYSLIDPNVSLNKVYYYRLRTIDLDGTVQLSGYIAVKVK